MALTDRVLCLAGLLEIALPSKTIRLCDGAFVVWPSVATFTAKDPDYGTIGQVEPVAEGISDDAPSGRLTLLPPSTTSAAALFQPDAQGSAITSWIAEVDRETNQVVGDPELMFEGLVDTITVSLSRGQRRVDIDYMAAAERLFMVREGNVLSSRWHQSIWPGETGLDHCTDADVAVPWGIAGGARGTVGSSGTSTSYTGFSGPGAFRL